MVLRRGPASAVRDEPRPTGVVEESVAGNVVFLQGRLKLGEPMRPR